MTRAGTGGRPTIGPWPRPSPTSDGLPARAAKPVGDNGLMARQSSSTPSVNPAVPCPCGLGLSYGDCCGRLHRGESAAATAEQLMRSRFSAFALHEGPYLLRSWHPDTRPRDLRFDGTLRWTRLEILDSSGGGLFDSAGAVAFRAHYLDGGKPGSMQENSRFVRHDGAWVYVSAIAAPR
jgi:SEC-C motif domain protein